MWVTLHAEQKLLPMNYEETKMIFRNKYSHLRELKIGIVTDRDIPTHFTVNSKDEIPEQMLLELKSAFCPLQHWTFS